MYSFKDQIIEVFADNQCKQITRRVISQLMKCTDLLSGDDTILTNTWDEICVQLQGEKSFYWKEYEAFIHQHTKEAIKTLPSHMKQATVEAAEWLCDFDEESSETSLPVDENEIVSYSIDSYILFEVANWSNS